VPTIGLPDRLYTVAMPGFPATLTGPGALSGAGRDDREGAGFEEANATRRRPARPDRTGGSLQEACAAMAPCGRDAGREGRGVRLSGLACSAREPLSGEQRQDL
jgi:hypothetical protein